MLKEYAVIENAFFQKTSWKFNKTFWASQSPHIEKSQTITSVCKRGEIWFVSWTCQLLNLMTQITSIAANLETVRGRDKTVKKRITPALSNVETVGRENGNCCRFSKNSPTLESASSSYSRTENWEHTKRETQTQTHTQKGFKEWVFFLSTMIQWTKQLNAAFGASFLWLICMIYFTQVSILQVLFSFYLNFKSFGGINDVFFF